MTAVTLELPISTDRLTLRWYRSDDLDALYDLRSRDDVIRYIPWHRRTRDECVEWLESKIAGRSLESPGDVLSLALTGNEGDVYIGEGSGSCVGAGRYGPSSTQEWGGGVGSWFLRRCGPIWAVIYARTGMGCAAAFHAVLAREWRSGQELLAA